MIFAFIRQLKIDSVIVATIVRRYSGVVAFGPHGRQDWGAFVGDSIVFSERR
jgi:hypothetical protein